jgi:eukaryotic-like serine/threonine-protein kinase
MTDSSQRWTVPGYTEVKKLGAGGFGTVMLARHDATGTTVAIKYLLPEVGQKPGYAELFRAEAESLGALDTPYVVKLYEYVESGANAAIVMELVNGVTLGDILSEHGATTPEAALVVLFGSLLGLSAAHRRGVVHRDFKPGNVLVNARGASKLTDFGIAARSGRPTVPAGSVPYAPPEQFGGGPASPAGDVYSATATFYECLTGQPPFTGPTTESVIAQHRSAPVPMEPVPEALRSIVARGLAKDPAWRPADGAALASELRTAATGAYGADWERRGRSHLGEAAVLLAALWPSAGGYAVGGFQTESVHLAQAAQHGQGGQAAHQAGGNARAGAHRWHLRHVQHEEHLAHLRGSGGRTATRVATRATTRGAGRLHSLVAVAGAAAVVAAGVTVAATSRAPGGSGTAGHPAVAAYSAAVASIPATLASDTQPVNGNVYVTYGSNVGAAGSARITGDIPGATAGEVAQLYAQQFPFTGPPVLVQSDALSPARGSAAYVFSLDPTLATRYQVKLARSSAAAVPLAVSAPETVYVMGYAMSAYENATPCTAGTACPWKVEFTVHVPASAIQAEMTKQKYLYMGTNNHVSAYPQWKLATGAASQPQRVADDEYQVTLSYTVSHGEFATYAFCTMANEAQDGFGLPGPSPCGAAVLPETDLYVLGYGSIPTSR